MELNDIIMLREHLCHNFVPPIGHAYDCAVEAIEAVNSGEYDREIETPSGRNMTAGEVCEELHLEYFIEEAAFEWDE